MPNNNGLLTDINVLMAEFRPYRTLKEDNRKLLLYWCTSMRLVLEQYSSAKIILCNIVQIVFIIKLTFIPPLNIFDALLGISLCNNKMKILKWIGIKS